MSKRRLLFLAAVLSAFALVAAGCGSDSDDASGGGDSGGSEDVELSIVAYSTPEAAYGELTEAFQQTDAGAGVTFQQSFGSSGDQSRAVAEQGLPADVVEFSLEPDMNRLVDNEIVAADWNETPTDGNVTESVVVFMVRSGNPEGIETWEDLTADGIEVINPNPFTSGGARWNVMAAYASQIEQGATEEEAIQYLNDLYANVTVQDDSARKSLETFTGGAGDVLLGYENEAIFAQQNGADIDYVVPPQTILIENPVAVTETTEHAEQAQAFYDYLFTEEGQQIFADNGYRPVIDGVDPPEGFEFPTDIAIADIDDFGGWTEVMDTFFDTEDSIMKDVQEGIGVQVES